MSIQAIADTHAAIWYVFNDNRLSVKARDFIEATAASGNHIGVSPMTLVEIVYLSERGKVRPETFQRLLSLLEDATVLQETPFNNEIAQIMRNVRASQIPEMPDRVIAATARHYKVPVITVDWKITASEVETIW